MPNIEKARISSKHYGFVRAYAANSHPGPLSQINEDRVRVVTNLNKTTNKARQVSFFAIYDGCDGACFADYMRDCFHVMLIKDDLFWKDVEAAIRSTVRKVEKSFNEDPAYSKDISSASFVIVVVIGTWMVIQESPATMCRLGSREQ